MILEERGRRSVPQTVPSLATRQRTRYAVPMTNDLPTISQAANELVAGRLTPLQLVESCLARIQKLEPTLRAWVCLDEERARNDAERLDALLREGTWLGPLHGIPVGVKDLIDVAGLPTRAGSSLTSPEPVADDAPVVQRLRAAGAIVLGKTVTTEWACFDPPPTRNPWNLAHTPGGSSSGSAVAVAAGMCLAALGSQTGGSIIRPASYCGVAGLKPTHGRVSTRHVVPISHALDHVGPIARNATDLWHMFRAIVDDRRGVPNELPEPPDGWRLGWVAGLFDDEADTDVRDAFHEALGMIRAHHPALAEVVLPASFAGVHASHWRIMAVDAATVHREAFATRRDAFGPKVASLIEEGFKASAIDYTTALEHQRVFRDDMAELLGEKLILLMPSTNTVAPGQLDTTGNPRFNSPWSFAGLPAVTIPCGLNRAGLPCGLQLVGPAFHDPLLLRVTQMVEQWGIGIRL